MTPLLEIITNISFIGICAVFVVRFIKFRHWRAFIAQLAVTGIAFVLVYYYFYRIEIPAARGEGNGDIYVVIVLYLCMLLGMVSHSLYARLEQPKKKRPHFDFGLFIAPVFASPIVFIPLISALQNADVDLMKLTTPKLMIFFLAFENGFFWKEYFDNRRRSTTEGVKNAS